jgi:hypothetical protein
MSKDQSDKRVMPKGGRKGGTQFPQINLADAERYCKKLVSKTHNGPQPSTVILKGVFDSAGPTGKVRASALKQYGLMQGESAAYMATALAKDLISAPPEERQKHLAMAFLNVKIFKALHDTFIEDTVSLAKLRQQASQLEVHPDNQELAVKLFVESAVSSGLATQDGDNVTLIRLASEPTEAQAGQLSREDASSDAKIMDSDEEEMDNPSENNANARSARAVINVNVSLDSSLDTEKLEKQLKLLRRYGAI